MTKPTLMTADEITDPCATFTPDEFMSVGFGAGHIGRFYWDNQKTLTIEFQCSDGSWERYISEVPGSSALISTLFDWWAWLWT
jgi:hypothetical protein